MPLWWTTGRGERKRDALSGARRHEREEIEMYKTRNEAQIFFKNVKRLTKGFKLEASSCRDDRGNLVTDAQGVLRL